MADNIKVIGDILNVDTVSRYSEQDTNLLVSQTVKESFGNEGDYIEFFLYDAGNNLLNVNYNYLDYKLPPSSTLLPSVAYNPNVEGNIQTSNVGVESVLTTTGSLYPNIEIDPVKDVQSLGYTTGEFISKYFFFKRILSNPTDAGLFIREISSDRTELRIASTTISDTEIESAVVSMLDELSNSTFYVDFILNFSNGQQVVAVNVALNPTSNGNEILFKLYEPLPLEIQEKDTLWVVSEKVKPYSFNINLDTLILPPPAPTLRGPNFSIVVPNQSTVSTSYTNYDNLLLNLQSLQKSSYNQMLNLLTSQSIDINVDYTDFNNFNFFGSAEHRLANFFQKVKQIEDYNTLITSYQPQIATVPSLVNEINYYSSSINTIISGFDGFERFMYFESGSYSWPKTSSSKPYVLQSTGSAEVVTWYNSMITTARDYDELNPDNLIYALPDFIIEDENNQQFLTFVNMVGHYFDNIWIYLKAITDINLSNNNLEKGISKDLVYNQLKSLGIKLYNSQAGEELDKFLVGANTGSATYTGYLTDFSPTGSYLNNIPRTDLVAEVYKRLYHNLPLLMKTKGTARGLETLITTFGITGSILNVKEYGGGLKTDQILGYNDEKVRIVSNNITGSVLTPLLSLQTYPTASTSFRDEDLHYVDISFSPQNQIDTYTSGAIASNNPTWSLDDYIGNPNDLYKSTYPELDNQKKLYYETGVTGFPGFTGSYMDYSGFIRLIQFFDNALFKMLNDFVPERTSLSTGITFNSPVLERNKAPYSQPNFTTESVQLANYTGSPAIGEQYGKLYDSLGGDKSAFFNGEIEGSEINAYSYFEKANVNPYLGNFEHWNANHLVSESIDLYKFAHSDFDVLQNNVSSSIPSIIRKKLEPIFGTTASLLLTVELQDSYLTLTSYNNSRYEGSKVVSLTYNTYTSASYTGSDGRTVQLGDKSFGKTAAIDLNTRKLGLFSEVTEDKIYGNRANIALKYLVNERGELTELNQNNKNWFEIQNTFVQDGTLTVSQFDNKKYSNQKSLDGSKNIILSGYSLNPILYYSLNSSYLNFYVPEFISSSYVEASFKTGGFISSSAPLYPINTNGSYTGLINNIFDNVISANSSYHTGSANGTTTSSLTRYISPDTANYELNTKLNLIFTPDNLVTSSVFYTPNAGFAKYDFTIYQNPTESNITNGVTGNTVVVNNSQTYLFNQGKLYTTTGSIGVSLTSSEISSWTNYQTAGGYVESNYPISAYAQGQDAGVSRWAVRIVVRVTNPNGLQGGETVHITLGDWPYNPIGNPPGGISNSFVTVDDDIVALPNAQSRLQAFADKIVTELIARENNIVFIDEKPFIESITSNSFTIKMTLNDFGDNNSIRTPVAKAISFKKTLSPAQSITLNSNIYNNSGDILVEQGTTLYQYTNAFDINLNNNVSSSITSFWSPSSSLELRFKANNGSNKYTASLSSFQLPPGSETINYIIYRHLYLPTSSLGAVYVLPENIVDFNNNSGIQNESNIILTTGSFDTVQDVFIEQNDRIFFTLRESDKYPANFAYRGTPGNSTISLLKISNNPNLISIPNDGNGFLDPNLTTTNKLVFSERVSNIFNINDVIFNPNREGEYQSDLYEKYGDIDFEFSLSKGDIVLIKDRNNTPFEFQVSSASFVGGQYTIDIIGNIPQQMLDNILGNIAEQLYYEMFLIRKIPDETNAVIKFTKKEGKTSYGFIIPEDLSPEVFNNIDTITREVKQKLIEDQSIIDSISGGEF